MYGRVQELIGRATEELKIGGDITKASVLANLALAEAVQDLALELPRHALGLKQAAHSMPTSVRAHF
jgi:hypothetical protein